jgi:glycosyltransferase involved in cell wall biosynthesis
VVKFFRGHDEKHLAECMLELIKDPEARVRLSSNALKFVADKGWDVKKTEYLDLVDRLASNA